MKIIGKIISIILVCVILIILSPKIRADSNINLKVESKQVDSEEFSVKISVDSIVDSISGIKMDLYYDNTSFQVVDGKKLSAAGGSIDLYENYANEGRVRIGIVSIIGMSKPGDLYEIKFKILNTTNLDNKAEFKLTVKETTDNNGNTLETSTEDGIITFSGINIENKNEKDEDSKIIINIDDIDDIDNIETSENINISLNDTNIKNQNINSIINERNTNLDTNSILSYKVENEDIVAIDEDGNIIAKTTGDTNIIVTDENGNQEIITISVINNDMKDDAEHQEYENNNIVNKKIDKNLIAIIVIILIVLIVTMLIIIKKRNTKALRYK